MCSHSMFLDNISFTHFLTLRRFLSDSTAVQFRNLLMTHNSPILSYYPWWLSPSTLTTLIYLWIWFPAGFFLYLNQIWIMQLEGLSKLRSMSFQFSVAYFPLWVKVMSRNFLVFSSWVQWKHWTVALTNKSCRRSSLLVPIPHHQIPICQKASTFKNYQESLQEGNKLPATSKCWKHQRNQNGGGWLQVN